MKKALIYSPYWESLGGGEVYALSFAKVVESLGHQVFIASSDLEFLASAKERLGVSLQSPELDQLAYEQFRLHSSLYDKWRRHQQYDLIFWVSDGSLPFLFGRNNLVHFQVPFTNLSKGLVSLAKMTTIDKLVCNSQFTREVIERRLKSRQTVVLYPPIKEAQRIRVEKTKTILSVGRLTNTLVNKRQDILIKAFGELVDQGVKDWRLVVAGSTSEIESDEYLKKLKAMSKGLPIDFEINISNQQLQHLYASSSIFWHAAGFAVDERLHPEHVEHFGMVTAEAMSYGCVPIVIGKGGQKEVVRHRINGFLCDNVDDLVGYTKEVVESPKLLTKISQEAKKSVLKFSYQSFASQVEQLLNKQL